MSHVSAAPRTTASARLARHPNPPHVAAAWPSPEAAAAVVLASVARTLRAGARR